MDYEQRIHPLFVRITHWLLVASFLALVTSGAAILVSHPRLYWGETGTWAMDSLVDLPLPIIFGHSGWGRYLHFLAAWILVLSGLVYVLTGLVNGHIKTRLVPGPGDVTRRSILAVIADHLHWRRPAPNAAWRYNVVQRLAYLVVIFVLFPAMVWTGLAMSPTMTAQYPFLVTVLGGHQSARTVHFIVANLLLVFLLVHLVMLVLVGFRAHLMAMITGRKPPGETGS